MQSYLRRIMRLHNLFSKSRIDTLWQPLGQLVLLLDWHVGSLAHPLNCTGSSVAISINVQRVKCRAQLLPRHHTPSSLSIIRDIYRSRGVRGLYFGGLITSLRDSIGYGFYFWGYEGAKHVLLNETDTDRVRLAKMLGAGGIAGCITWASVYPLGTPTPRLI